jgi:hypothetical protein
MMLFLAQISDIAPDWLRNMALFVAAAAATIYYLMGAFGRKQKREVSFHETPATKKEFDEHVAWNRREHENLFSKIGGVERGVTARIEARLNDMQSDANEAREKIHHRINNQSRMLYLIAGKLGVQVSRDGEDTE